MSEQIVCARNGCENIITEKKKFNQKYCCYECCKIATNERLMERYYERKARLRGDTRYCTGCESKLSRYNKDDICNACIERRRKERNELIDQLFKDVIIT